MAGAVAIAAGFMLAAAPPRGPLVDIEFDRPSDIVAGTTVVRYQSVAVGVVESVRAGRGRGRLQVAARLQPQMAAWLAADARFRLRQGHTAGTSFIDFQPGTLGRKRSRSFIGTEMPLRPLADATPPLMPIP
jgi:hypothetical protein